MNKTELISARKRVQRRREADFEKTTVAYTGKIISRNGSVHVPGILNHVWVLPTDESEPEAVYNRTVKDTRPDLPVVVGFFPKSTVLEILRTDVEHLAGYVETGGLDVPNHGDTHRSPKSGGVDPTWVDRDLIIDQVYLSPGSGLAVNVSPYEYDSHLTGSRVYFPGQLNFSIAAHKPAAGLALYVLVYLDTADNTIKAVAGATSPDLGWIIPTKPDTPAGGVTAGYVRLDGSQTAVSRNDIDQGRRMVFATGLLNRVIFDAKGDLLSASADNTPAILTVGANNTRLIPDSTQATGLRWGRLDNYTAITDPTPTDDSADGYEVGSEWINTTEGRAWKCVNATVNSAVWKPFGIGPLATLFLHEEASDIATYQQLLETPAEDAENDDSVAVNSGDGEVLIMAFASEAGGLGLTLLPGGAWEFHIYSYVDNAVGVSQVVIRVYQYETDTTETELFNVTSQEINDTSVTEYTVSTVQPDFPLASTDRLVVKFFAQTTSVADRTVHLVYEGTTNYSHIHTPLSSSGGAVNAWPFPQVITVGTNGDFATVDGAISDAGTSAGDVILVGEDTSEASVTLDKAVTIRGVSPEITLTVTGSNDGLQATVSGYRIENLRVANTTTGATSRAIRCDESGVLDSVIAVCSGGNTRYGVYVAASKTVDLIGCDVSGSGGSSTDAGLVVDGTANVYGGKYAGDDYSLLVGAAGDVTLKDVTLSGNLYTAGGVIRGTAKDTKGRDCGVIVTNISGGAVIAGDIGYLDEAGEFKTTTTAGLLVNWHVVTVGGLDSGPIFVKRVGNATVNYTGSDPAAGDYLTTSTSAGDALATSTMQPGVFAICLAAGSGGTVEVLLLCNRVPVKATSTNSFFRCNNSTGSTFSSTINGAPSGTSVVYNAPTGNEDSIVPVASTELAKLVLHNTTRSNYALISSVNTGTNTITVTSAADISTWQSGDSIQVNSLTITGTSVVGNAVFDLRITSSEIPRLAVALLLDMAYVDSGAPSSVTQGQIHPFDGAYSGNKAPTVTSAVAGGTFRRSATVPIYDQTVGASWGSSGAGAATFVLRLSGYDVAAP